ncbi:MAG: M12 family metallo-peptidase [Planctomycetota bacterium]|jgi:hypothetical protein
MNLQRLMDLGLRTALAPVLAAMPAAASAAPVDRPPIVLSMTADSAPSAYATGQFAGAARDRRVVFELADGLSVAGVVRDRRDRAPGRFTISGPVDTMPVGRFVVAVNGDAFAAYVTAGAAGAFRLRTGPGAAHLAEKVDPGAGFTCGVDSNRGLNAAARGGVAGVPCDDGSVIDVLVVYTQAALDQVGSIAALEAEIDLTVEYNNVAYVDSGIASSWNLAYVWKLPAGVDPNLGELHDPADGVADSVHTLRDAYQADVVALVVDGGGGVAFGIYDLDPAQEADAFSVNGLNSFPIVMPHEIGHNLGCCHALGDGGGCPAEGGLLFPYSNGHRFFGDSGEEWHTIMAYSPGVVIGHFSNPLVPWDGQPTGVPEGETGAADNTATINISRDLLANYRCHDGICEALGLPSDAEDCTGNGVPDLCDIALGTVEDGNGNGIPDECESSCPWDLDGSGAVGVNDFLELLAVWGQTGVPADFDGGGVGVTDFLILLANWGPCPPE